MYDKCMTPVQLLLPLEKKQNKTMFKTTINCIREKLK